ncbi:MAG TPA: LEA type 2 family protein [Rhizobacter sp.]|jgi:LEA14-like dessication related protein|nr:LEA type 2 family protein [Rhizobacter sp.]
MKKRTFCQGVSMAGAIWLLSACAGMGFHQPLQVNLVGIDPLPGEGMEMRMAVKLRVQNPNDAALDFDGVSLTFELRGTTFATGVSAEHGSVPRFGETVVTVPVSVSALTVMRQFIGMAGTKEKQAADYTLRGRLSGTGFGGVQFESKGEISVMDLLQPK